MTDPIGGVYDHNYDANGNRESLLFPNGVATTYAYNAKNQLPNISTVNNAGTTLAELRLHARADRQPDEDRRARRHHAELRLRQPLPPDRRARDAGHRARRRRPPGEISSPTTRSATDSEQLRQTENGTPQPVDLHLRRARPPAHRERDQAHLRLGRERQPDQRRAGPDGATYVWDIENRLDPRRPSPPAPSSSTPTTPTARESAREPRRRPVRRRRSTTSSTPGTRPARQAGVSSSARSSRRPTKAARSRRTTCAGTTCSATLRPNPDAGAGRGGVGGEVLPCGGDWDGKGADGRERRHHGSLHGRGIWGVGRSPRRRPECVPLRGEALDAERGSTTTEHVGWGPSGEGSSASTP